MNNQSKIVITGMGVVSPIGIGIEEFGKALRSKRSGIQLRPEFEDHDWPLKLYGPIPDFDGKQYVRPRKALKVMCKPIQFGYTAATMALEHSGLSDFEMDPNRLGSVFGSETFFADPMEVADVFRKCVQQQNYQHERWGEFAMRDIQPLWMLKYLPNMVTSHISIAADARGPSNSICQGEVSGLLALIEGVDLIRRGACDAVVVGGAGSQTTLSGMLYRGQHQISKRIDDPENAVRPFDADRDGTVYSEGAGALIIESEEFALQRGASILGEVLSCARGYNSIENADDFSGAIAGCIEMAMERSSCNRDEFSHVNAHGCSHVQRDIDEARAIRHHFADTPVVAYKSNLGHVGPAGPIVELIGSMLSLDSSTIIAGRNFDTPDEACGVNVLRESQACSKSKCLKLAFSQTGQIASVVFGRHG